MTLWTRRKLFGLTLAAICAPVPAISSERFSVYPGLRSLIASDQTAIVRIAELNGTEILLLLLDGTPVEAHARRNGLYQPKDARRSTSPKPLAPVDFNRLITQAGGLNLGVGGTDRHAAFMALYKTLKPSPPSVQACPAELERRSAADISAIRRELQHPDNRRFVPCFSLGPDAQRLPLSEDPMFRTWTFERDVQGHFLGLTLPGLKAVWSLEA